MKLPEYKQDKEFFNYSEKGDFKCPLILISSIGVLLFIFNIIGTMIRLL
jgi:hypothetical protein